MSDRETVRAELACHPVINSEPTHADMPQHPGRRRYDCLQRQARATAIAAIRRQDARKFLVFARPRSGTTLLGHLLGQVPGIQCDGEVMQNIVAFPDLYMRILARQSREPIYGFKLLSYQMLDVQLIRDPLGFMERAVGRGWSIIHIRRRTYSQTLSLSKAQAGSGYFDTPDTIRPASVEVSVDRFADMVAWNVGMLDFEDRLMAMTPHLRLDYETDLKDATVHQRTIDRVCDYLGVPAGPVAARMKRSGGASGTVATTNEAELRAVIANGPYAHLLDADSDR